MSGGCARRTPRGNCPVTANRNATLGSRRIAERNGEKCRQRREQRGVVANGPAKDPVFTARLRGARVWQCNHGPGCNYYVFAEADHLFAVISAVSPKPLAVAIESDRN